MTPDTLHIRRRSDLHRPARHREVTAMNLGVTELLIILAVVLLLFGSTRLPALAKSLGQAKREFDGSHSESAEHEAV
jgi:TatA/E family protein of Tat protein translocase